MSLREQVEKIEEANRKAGYAVPEDALICLLYPEARALLDDAALLSRILFEARERVEMAADMVESRTGQTDAQGRRLVDEIDTYRAGRGWSPHGFGGES